MIQKNWQALIKPAKLDVVSGTDPKRLATIVAEPLERGYGLTLGNALRRVLLSSLQGAAVTAIQIDSVLHEFSSIPGVHEDVTDIVLNIKSLALRMHGEGPKRISLIADGPCEVTLHYDGGTEMKLATAASGLSLLAGVVLVGWQHRRRRRPRRDVAAPAKRFHLP